MLLHETPNLFGKNVKNCSFHDQNFFDIITELGKDQRTRSSVI